MQCSKMHDSQYKLFALRNGASIQELYYDNTIDCIDYSHPYFAGISSSNFCRSASPCRFWATILPFLSKTTIYGMN